MRTPAGRTWALAALTAMLVTACGDGSDVGLEREPLPDTGAGQDDTADDAAETPDDAADTGRDGDDAADDDADGSEDADSAEDGLDADDAEDGLDPDDAEDGLDDADAGDDGGADAEEDADDDVPDTRPPPADVPDPTPIEATYDEMIRVWCTASCALEAECDDADFGDCREACDAQARRTFGTRGGGGCVRALLDASDCLVGMSCARWSVFPGGEGEPCNATYEAARRACGG